VTAKPRTWIGTLQRPTDFIDFSACDHTDRCTCPRKVEVPIRSADGRTIVAVLTADEAQRYAEQLLTAAEFARDLS